MRLRADLSQRAPPSPGARSGQWRRPRRHAGGPRQALRRLELPNPHDPAAERAVEAAIAHVLSAEDAARAAVVAAQAQAATSAEAARAAARTLAQRTAARIGAIRTAFEASVAAQVAALEAEGAALVGTHAPTARELTALEQALARLAAELADGRDT